MHSPETHEPRGCQIKRANSFSQIPVSVMCIQIIPVSGSPTRYMPWSWFWSRRTHSHSATRCLSIHGCRANDGGGGPRKYWYHTHVSIRPPCKYRGTCPYGHPVSTGARGTLRVTTQRTQNISITFIQCWTNVENAGAALYKCNTNVLCSLGTGHREW